MANMLTKVAGEWLMVDGGWWREPPAVVFRSTVHVKPCFRSGGVPGRARTG